MIMQKKMSALDNGYRYIEIDARYSEQEYIKLSVENSDLPTMIPIKEIDWNMCHENACKSLVKESCELWNQGKRIFEIKKILGIGGTDTIVRYLKNGEKLGLCIYKPKEILRSQNYKDGVPVVQLSLEGDFINKFNSMSNIKKTMPSVRSVGNITSVCQGRRKTAYGYRWMYADEYYRD